MTEVAEEKFIPFYLNRMMKMKKKRDSKAVWIWYSNYQWIIPMIFTALITGVAYGLRVKPWLGEAYSDMLTALITVQSIIISVFGILIPSLVSVKDEEGLAGYFFKNADVEDFVKRVKRTVLSGILDIFLICVLYAYDVLPIKVYVVIEILCLFVLLYFLCGSYRYVSIMLKLLIVKKNEYKGKDFKRRLTDQEREDFNKKLHDKS